MDYSVCLEQLSGGDYMTVGKPWDSREGLGTSNNQPSGRGLVALREELTSLICLSSDVTTRASTTRGGDIDVCSPLSTLTAAAAA